MPLMPRALRPMTYVRRRALRSGMQSRSELARFLSVLIVGRPALVRQNAFRQGVRGSSRLWRMVAVGLFVGDIWRKATVKEPDRLGTERLIEGQGVTVLAMTRPSKRDLRRASRSS